MSPSLLKWLGKSTSKSSRKRKNSQEKKDTIHRKELYAASRSQPIACTSGDVGDAQSREAGDGSNPGISRLPSQVPSFVREMKPGSGDGQCKEAVGGSNLGLPISTVAPPIATDSLQSVDHGARVVQSREISNTSSVHEVSNTARNVHIGTAQFMGGGHAFGNKNTVNNVLMIIRSGDGEFTEVERNSISDYIANHAVLPTINDQLSRRFLTQLIINLPRAEAVFNDYQTQKKCGPCFEGTRVALLREVADWITDPDESRMYVLSGLAGIGKSTVAYTIASRAADLNLLGASFFFSRDEVDRKNAKKFFTTIAYQLCVYCETFAEAIGEVLQTERGSAATTKGPQDQLHALIIEPLRRVVQSRVRPILIIIDAVDECDEEDEPYVFTGLKQLVQNLPSFKVILTTRPHPHLDHLLGYQDGHKIFRLQDIEDKVVDDDIRLYPKHSLSMEQVQKQPLRRPWCASDEQIDSLVCAAGRLFIIASTSVRFIFAKGAPNPATQMQKLLDAFAQGQTPFKDLNQFYTIILRNVVPVDCDDDIINYYQSIVGAIVFVQHPLPVTTLGHLIKIDAEEIRAVLGNLQSVILLGDDDIPRIYHKSFPDYITDLKRCQDINLRIDPIIRHTQITMSCFQTMKQHLKYNILSLGDPARFMSNKDGLAKDGITNEQLEENIPQQLRYACVYWGNHIEIENVEEVGLMNELELFTNEHMLHWFEALSLIEKLESAHRAIRTILQVLKPTSSDLRQLLSDGLRFISKFYQLIEGSALHTYYSALPFTPTNSLLYRVYIKKASHNFCDVIGGPDNWDALVASRSYGTFRMTSVEIVKFSADSTLFVTWEKDFREKDFMKNISELKIRDAITGTPVSTISGEKLCFAITNDFSTIASFHDNTISLHNMNGSEQGTTFTTQAEILQVAIFKSESTSRIAAALSDGTVCLWDSSNGELVGCFGDYERPGAGWRHRLEFSETGARFAYTSTNDVVKLRDGTDGRLIADLDDSRDFEFSADDSRIVTSPNCAKLWSSEDGKLIGTFGRVTDMKPAISADGSLIATRDRTEVELWNGSGTHIDVLSIESIYLMVFSSDDTLAIATSFNITLYNVKTRFMAKLSISSPNPLAISPDCSHLAAADGDNPALFLWDLRYIEASSPFPDVQTDNNLTSLALSSDCSLIACGFWNGAVELKETDGLPNQLRPGPNRDHSEAVWTLGFSPDGRRFVSGSNDGTIKLWSCKDGTLRGTLRHPFHHIAGYGLLVELSNRVVASAGNCCLILWDCETLDQIHTVKGSPDFRWFSFSANGALLAGAYNKSPQFEAIVFDVAKGTTIATVDVDGCRMTFLPDNSQLLMQRYRGDDILAFDLVNKTWIRGPTFEHFIQLCNMPLWHDVPVKMSFKYRQEALFSQHKSHVPLLRLPDGLKIQITAYGRSVIALAHGNGHIILLRPCTSQYE